MKTLTLIVLLVTSQFANALTKQEQQCLALNVYHEARSLSKLHWLKVANVAINRKKNFKKYNFGAKSSHLCDIVKSKQYSTKNKLLTSRKEKEIFEKIFSTLSKVRKWNYTNALYFELQGTKHVYSTTWKK